MKVMLCLSECYVRLHLSLFCNGLAKYSLTHSLLNVYCTGRWVRLRFATDARDCGSAREFISVWWVTSLVFFLWAEL